MPFAKVNKIDVYYEVHGEGEPLVLVAGLSCSTSHWLAVLDELAERFKVVVFDNRGVGRSDAPDEPYTIEQMAADALALMDELNIEKAYMLGHSMGGCIGQQIARHAPHRIRKLLLSNSLIKMNAVSLLAQKSILQLRMDGVPIRRLAEVVLPWLFSSAYLSDPLLIEKTIEGISTNPFPQKVVGQKRQMEALAQFNSSEWLRDIHVPVLVVGCKEDIMCPRESQRIANTIPNAQFIEMEGVGHIPMVERPVEYNKILFDFFQ